MMGIFILGVSLGAIGGILWCSGPELLKSMFDAFHNWKAKR